MAILVMAGTSAPPRSLFQKEGQKKTRLGKDEAQRGPGQLTYTSGNAR